MQILHSARLSNHTTGVCFSATCSFFFTNTRIFHLTKRFVLTVNLLQMLTNRCSVCLSAVVDIQRAVPSCSRTEDLHLLRSGLSNTNITDKRENVLAERND